MAPAESATAPTKTAGEKASSRGSGRKGSWARSNAAGQQRERRHHRHLGQHLPAHRGPGGARRPAQPELAQPLRDALPDHAGQAERDHQQQEAGDDGEQAERRGVVAQLLVAQVIERGNLERPVRGLALQPPDQHRFERGRRARPDADQEAIGHAADVAVDPHAVEQHRPRHRGTRRAGGNPRTRRRRASAAAADRSAGAASLGSTFSGSTLPTAFDASPNISRARLALRSTGSAAAPSSSRVKPRPGEQRHRQHAHEVVGHARCSGTRTCARR